MYILSSYLIYAICIILLLNPSFTYNVIKLTSCQIALLYNLFTYSSINFCSDLTLWLIVASEWNASLLFLSLFSPFLCLCVDTVPEEVMQCPWYHLSLKLPHGDLSKWRLYLHFSLSLFLSVTVSHFILSFAVLNYLSFFFLLYVTAVILEPL